VTNREKLNNMSNEELATLLEEIKRKLFCNGCVAREYCVPIPHYEFTGCKNVIEEWLEQEAEE
jgi:hypothetical protein